jgi:hypothetical protein
LKAAVFILGSMAVGGAMAHLSGDAIWQRMNKTSAPALEPIGGTMNSGGKEEVRSENAAADLKKMAPSANMQNATTEPSPPGVTLRPPPPSSLKSKLVD